MRTAKILVTVDDNGIGMENPYRSLDEHSWVGIENMRSRIQTIIGGTAMRFLAVDDEQYMLDELTDALRSVCPEAEVTSCISPEDALAAAKKDRYDVAFLDIEMSGMTGLELTVRLRENDPDIRIVFVTAYSQYAVEAFGVHATGYLLKPVDREALKRELTFIYEKEEPKKRIRVQTFGGFDVFVDGRPVKFGRSRAKELLAYLIDHRGAAVTTGDAYAALFEDARNTVSGKSYFRTIVHDMKISLKKAGAEGMLVKGFNSLAVAPDTFDCDLYRFLDGDPAAVNQYHNDYLPSYSWAEFRNAAFMFRREDGWR